MSELYELLTFEAFGQRYPELTSRHQILPGRGVFCKAAGYFCMDNRDCTAEHLVFNRSVSLKDSFKK